MTRKQTVIHLHGNVKNNVLAKDLKKGEIIVLHPESGATEFGTLDFTGNQIAWFQDYESTKTYIDTTVGGVSDRVTALEGLTGTTTSALQEITKGTDGSYVTTTIGAKTEDKKQSVGVAVTVQEVSGATTEKKGLAEALDVKNYVDGAKNAVLGEINAVDAKIGNGFSNTSTVAGQLSAVNAKIGNGFSETSTVAGQLSAVKDKADSAVQTVEGTNTVNATTEANKVTLSLVTSNKGNVKFSQGTDGLSANVEIPAATVTGVKAEDKVLSLTDKLVSATVSLEYGDAVSEALGGKKTIKLLGKDSTLISEIDASEFIKDGMLDTVELVKNPEGKTAGTYLKLTWNTDSGKTEPMFINVTELIDIYTQGTGIKIDNKKISVDTNIIATVQSVTDAKAELKGTAEDTKDAETISGAKKYADSLKTAIDRYTVNGKDISTNPVLDGSSIAVGGSGSHKDKKLDDTVEDIYTQIGNAATSGVTLFGGKTGEITINGNGGTGNYKVKLAMTGNELGATIEGLGTAAAENIEHFASAVQGGKADTAVQTVRVTNTDTNKITATKAENSTEVVLNFDSMVIDCGEF